MRTTTSYQTTPRKSRCERAIAREVARRQSSLRGFRFASIEFAGTRQQEFEVRFVYQQKPGSNRILKCSALRLPVADVESWGRFSSAIHRRLGIELCPPTWVADWYSKIYSIVFRGLHR